MRQCDLTEKYFQGSFGQSEAHLMSLSQRNLLSSATTGGLPPEKHRMKPRFLLMALALHVMRAVRHCPRCLPLQGLRRSRRPLLCRPGRPGLQRPRRPGLRGAGWAVFAQSWRRALRWPGGSDYDGPGGPRYSGSRRSGLRRARRPRLFGSGRALLRRAGGRLLFGSRRVGRGLPVGMPVIRCLPANRSIDRWSELP